MNANIHTHLHSHTRTHTWKHDTHTHETHITHTQTSGGAVRLVASRDIKAGELLTLSYGNLTNAELLLDFGCVALTDEHTHIHIFSYTHILYTHTQFTHTPT